MAASIFNGTAVKLLKNILKFKGGASIDASSAGTSVATLPNKNITVAGTVDILSDMNDLNNIGLSASVSSSVTINLVGATGAALSSSNVAKISFPDINTGTSGAVLQRTVSAPLSITFTPGNLSITASGIYQVYVYAIDNGGTVTLGVSGVLLPDTFYTTTALASGTFPTIKTSAAIGPVQCKVIGRMSLSASNSSVWSGINGYAIGNYATQIAGTAYAYNYYALTAAQTTLAPNNSSVPIVFNTTGYSDSLMQLGGGGKVYPPRAGFYEVTIMASISGTNTILNELIMAQLWINGSSAYNGVGCYVPVAGNAIYSQCTAVIQISTPGTDYVEGRVFASGNHTATNLTATTSSYMNVKFLGSSRNS